MTNRPPSGGRSPLWAWLTPSLLALGAMAVWGAVRYPELPDRVPLHMGADSVDAWAEKTVWTAFVPVLTYAAVTLVLVGCAAAAARITPLNEMPEPRTRWAAAANGMNNRPASAASARRTARALLLMNAWFGAGLVPLCWVQWRTSETAAVPAWLLPVTLALFVLAVVPVGVAWRRDAAEKRAA